MKPYILEQTNWKQVSECDLSSAVRNRFAGNRRDHRASGREGMGQRGEDHGSAHHSAGSPKHGAD